MNYYPAFINLKGKPCVVVGGGKIALRKVRALLKAEASVKVISPEVCEGIKRLAEKGKLKLTKRPFRSTDLKGAFLVIGATSSKELHKRIQTSYKGLLNVVDEPELCSFIMPGVIKRGPLIIAISTGGTSPALAKAIRKELEGLYGKAFSDYLRILGKLRKEILKLPSTKKKRLLKALSSQKILQKLRAGKLKNLLDELSLKERIS